ncbi:haptoglobin isoform X1 [Hylobates moloch]|uniref:haptoglobin isoform X1 n=1 Tax=Hylobates moloch TaxID=81572 RepID=UPI00136351C8|nr:haptoglobin isoform X1 [Hylobates moloch]
MCVCVCVCVCVYMHVCVDACMCCEAGRPTFHSFLFSLCRALGAVIALLLWGQLFAVDSGNDVMDIAGDGCPKPPEIAHGYVEHSVRYQCKNYYRLRTEGDGVYTLNNEKQWINKAVGDKLPECEAVCGKPKNPANPVQRILGGHLDAKGSFPWQAKMVSRHNLTTGATLINEQWLLTTAKNLFLNHSENATAKDIAPTLTLYVGKKQLVEIEKVVLHPNYSQVDIGLIKLKQKVPVNERVMPICLPSKDYAEVGRVGYVSGWGRNANFKFTDHLKYVMLPVADQDQCVRHYEGSTVPEKKTPKSPVGVQPILNEHTFCAGMSKYQEDTCYGDAGSAFAVHDLEKDTWYAAGILSFDKSCAVAEYGVYVKVTSIQDWVQKTIAEN